MRYLRLLVVCGALCAASDAAERYFKAAQRAEHSGDLLNAYLLYSRAASLDPKNPQYVAKKAALRGIAAVSARQELGPDPGAAAGEVPVTELSAADLLETREAIAPPRLAGSQEKKSFDLRGDAQTIFQKVAEAYGIQVIFDPDYQAPPPFRFQLADAEFEDAFRVLETVGNSFFVPVNEKITLVVRDTPQKRSERAPAMAVAIPIPERMSVQDANDVMTTVNQTFDIRRFAIDPTRHLIFIRDQTAKVMAARQMFYNLSKIRPQVAVDVEFLAVDRNSSLNYGMNLPNQVSIVNFQGGVSLPTAFRALRNLTGAATPFALGISQASVFATLARSRSDNVFQAQIFSVDGQPATLHVGQRYPIITSQYVGGGIGAAGPTVAPAPAVNFEDLGLALKITPWIHENDEVTLDVETEFKALGATSINGIPVVSNRKFTGKVRLREGEWAVLAGLIQITNSDTKSGIAWLSEIPLIGRLFSQNDIEKDSTEVLLVFKPHLTSLPAWETVQQPIWVGTETRPLSIY